MQEIDSFSNPMFTMKATKAPDVMIRQVGAESVILDLKSERYLGLDDVATRMWLALMEAESIEQAYERLKSIYRVEPQVLRDDLEGLVRELVDHGLVQLEPQRMEKE